MRQDVHTRSSTRRAPQAGARNRRKLNHSNPRSRQDSNSTTEDSCCLEAKDRHTRQNSGCSAEDDDAHARHSDAEDNSGNATQHHHTDTARNLWPEHSPQPRWSPALALPERHPRERGCNPSGKRLARRSRAAGAPTLTPPGESSGVGSVGQLAAFPAPPVRAVSTRRRQARDLLVAPKDSTIYAETRRAGTRSNQPPSVGSRMNAPAVGARRPTTASPHGPVGAPASPPETPHHEPADVRTYSRPVSPPLFSPN
jgi:hypothetical protein